MITPEGIGPLSKRPNVVYFHAVARAGRNNAKRVYYRREVQGARQAYREKLRRSPLEAIREWLASLAYRESI